MAPVNMGGFMHGLWNPIPCSPPHPCLGGASDAAGRSREAPGFEDLDSNSCFTASETNDLRQMVKLLGASFLSSV